MKKEPGIDALEGKWHRDYKELEGKTDMPSYEGYHARFPNETEEDYKQRMKAAPYGYYYDGCMEPDSHLNETKEEEERLAAAEASDEAKF